MHAARLALLAAASLSAGCFPPLPTVPTIQRTDAFCDADDNWNLFAQVSHEDGPEAVVSVYVEVGFAFYDENDEVYTEGAIGEPVDLLRTAGADDEWSAQLPSDPSFLDCGYEFEYYLLFVAEDEEGDQAGRTVVK